MKINVSFFLKKIKVRDTFFNNHRHAGPCGLLNKVVLDGNQNGALEVSYWYLIILVKLQIALLLFEGSI